MIERQRFRFPARDGLLWKQFRCQKYANVSYVRAGCDGYDDDDGAGGDDDDDGAGDDDDDDEGDGDNDCRRRLKG